MKTIFGISRCSYIELWKGASKNYRFFFFFFAPSDLPLTIQFDFLMSLLSSQKKDRIISYEVWIQVSKDAEQFLLQVILNNNNNKWLLFRSIMVDLSINMIINWKISRYSNLVSNKITATNLAYLYTVMDSFSNTVIIYSKLLEYFWRIISRKKRT